MSGYHGPLKLDKVDRREDLTEEAKAVLRQAWIQADDIRSLFEPEHIRSWKDLLSRLEEARNKARRSAELFGNVDLKAFDRDFSSGKIRNGHLADIRKMLTKLRRRF